jgi:hypothetical protein
MRSKPSFLILALALVLALVGAPPAHAANGDWTLMVSVTQKQPSKLKLVYESTVKNASVGQGCFAQVEYHSKKSGEWRELPGVLSGGQSADKHHCKYTAKYSLGALTKLAGAKVKLRAHGEATGLAETELDLALNKSLADPANAFPDGISGGAG